MKTDKRKYNGGLRANAGAKPLDPNQNLVSLGFGYDKDKKARLMAKYKDGIFSHHARLKMDELLIEPKTFEQLIEGAKPPILDIAEIELSSEIKKYRTYLDIYGRACIEFENLGLDVIKIDIAFNFNRILNNAVEVYSYLRKEGFTK